MKPPSNKNENPGAAATASGAKDFIEASQLRLKWWQKTPLQATHFWDGHANCIALLPALLEVLA